MNSLEEDGYTMIRAPRTIAIVKKILITEEKRDRTTSFQSNSTRIVSRDYFLKGGSALSHHQLKD